MFAMNESRLLFDVTKASRQRHKSGVLRVSSCLRRELAEALEERFVEVVWNERRRRFEPLSGAGNFEPTPDDLFVTAELFCEYERPGVEDFLRSRACRMYAIFHDAIPLRHPEFTWPHSVQRHPSYMKMLSLFSGVFAVSQHSAIALEEYWEWLGFEYSPSVKSLQLGADGVFREPALARAPREGPLDILILGIIETRKGQDLALDACERLWAAGQTFNLHVVGRANPYFGRELEKRMKRMEKSGLPIRVHGQIEDAELQALFGEIDLVLFPSRAEGCGLPALEALWQGLPVLSSGLAPVRETARFGGCRFFDTGCSADLERHLGNLLRDRDALAAMRREIRIDALPRWRETARQIIDYICPAHAFA